MKGGDFFMQETTKTYLVDKYNGLHSRTSAICLKFHYMYNGLNVNIYFDAYDTKSVSLSIVLASTEEKKYYYTPLNILNDNLTREYLPNIPKEILSKILVDNHLDGFYENMEEHILKDEPKINYYNSDKFFVNTIKYAKNKVDLPFWGHVRNIRMTDETLYKLNARADITLDNLRKIQSKGLTLVRTSDPKKRNNLTLILENKGIELT